MFQDTISIEKKHKRFIKTICASETVYALRNNNGFANSSSVYYQAPNGKPIGIICFWAEKSLAKSCIQKEWQDYAVYEIPITEFIENWCIGMGNDGLLVGTEFDQNLFGFEANPFELILDLIKELNSLNKDLNFRRFTNISDIESQVKSIIG